MIAPQRLAIDEKVAAAVTAWAPRGARWGSGSWAPPDRARDFLERAAAHVSGDDRARPLGDVAADRIGAAEAEHDVPYDDLPQIDDDGRRQERADDRGVPAPLLGDDDRVRALARLDLGEQRGARELGRLCALRIAGGEFRFVGVEKGVDDRRGEELCQPSQHQSPSFARRSVICRNFPISQKSASRMNGQAHAGRSSRTGVQSMPMVLASTKSCTAMIAAAAMLAAAMSLPLMPAKRSRSASQKLSVCA